jgi:undecaprenyl-diphosphatase
MKSKEISTAFNWNCVVLCVTLFVILTMLVMYMPNIRTIDGEILNSIRSWLSPYPSYIPLFIGKFGMDYGMLWPQIAAASVLVSHKLYTKATLLVVFTYGTLGLKELIKNYVCRERPLPDCEVGFSFPSGHASLSMCFYGILIYLVHRYVANSFLRNILIFIFGLWIFIVCVSRMWLGVHFPIDILAGAILGFMMVNLYIIICKVLKK